MIFGEANALKNLNHKNIVQVKEVFAFKNYQAVFIMDYLSGVKLYNNNNNKLKFNLRES